MNNKTKGTKFEKEFALLLFRHGFWVREDKGYAQTNDLIAAKNNIIYLFECKTCKKDYFNTNRVEDNQDMSRKVFKMMGNVNTWVAYKLDDGRIFLSKDFIKKPSEGLNFYEFLKGVK